MSDETDVEILRRLDKISELIDAVIDAEARRDDIIERLLVRIDALERELGA
jgi:hypothetical protein